MEALFSITTDKILVLFLRHPKAQFYPNQIVHLTHKYPNSVNQSLKRLVKLNLLKKRKVDNYEFYQLNKDNHYLEEIKAIFIKMGLLPMPRWRLVLNKILSHPHKKIDYNEDEHQCVIEAGHYLFNLSFNPSGHLSGEFKIIEKEG